MTKSIQEQLEQLSKVSIDPQRNTLNHPVSYGDKSRVESPLTNNRFAGMDPKEASQKYNQELQRVATNCPEFAPHDDCLITNSMPEYSHKNCCLCQHFDLGSCHIYLRERDK